MVCNNIREENFKKLTAGKKVFLYGAGEWTKRFLKYMGENVKEHISGILVSNVVGNPEKLDDISVLCVSDIIPDDKIIVIVTIYKNEEVIQDLNEKGFKNIIPLKRIMPITKFADYEIRRNHEVEQYIKYFEKNKPLFRYIEIETINRCNGACAFCPVNRYETQRPYHKMSKEMFQRIIGELAELEYDGLIGLFSNNEPFLDSRIVEFAEYTRKKLPKAYIHIFTNGKLLTLDRFKEIIPFINKMQIDNYEYSYKTNHIMEILQYCDENGIDDKVEYYEIDEKIERFSRAGEAPNMKIYYTQESLCPLLFTQIGIRPDGKVSLCCNDALGKNTLGDLEKNTLSEIWYGSTYEHFRKIMKEGRYGIESCRYCNTIDYRELWVNGKFYTDHVFDWEKCIFPKGFLQNDEIYIWGISKEAKELYKYLVEKDIRVKGFLESDYSKNHVEIYDGKYCYMLPEISLNKGSEKIGVYIATQCRYKEVYQELVEFGIDDIRLFIY